MCAQCPAGAPPDPAPWFSHCMLLHTLIEAGCRFGPDDLMMDEWLGLADLKAALEADKAEQMQEQQATRQPSRQPVALPGS
jgi:hypothetical protein